MAGRPRTTVPEGFHPAALALLLPPAMLALATLVMLTVALAGVHPLWSRERPTLSEAVAMRDLGALTVLLDAGHDPHAEYWVRAQVIDQVPMLLTPFEAAVAAHGEEVARFLRERGLRPADDEIASLVCLARQRRATDILALLGVPPTTVHCQ